MPDLSNVLQQLKKRQKHVKHEFQSFALMLAEKLNDKGRIPMYMKLAKSQPRHILNQALGFALDSKNHLGNNQGRLFLWHMKRLKEPLFKNIHLALVPQDKQQRQILSGKIMSLIYRKFRFKEMFNMVKEEQWSINLFSKKKLPETQIDDLIQINKNIQQKYSYPINTLLRTPIILWGKTLCLTCGEPLVFRSYYSIRKKINDSVVEASFPLKKPTFYLALGYLKKEFYTSVDEIAMKKNLQEIMTSVSINQLLIKMDLQLIIL